MKYRLAYVALGLSLTACASGFEASPHYATVAKHLDVGGQALLFTDVDGDVAAGAAYLDKLIERARTSFPDFKLERVNTKRLVGQLGLDQVQAIGLSSSRDGQAFHNKAFFAYGRPRRGLLLMADTPPHESEVLRQAPADVDLVFESDLHLKSLASLIETIAVELGGKDGQELFAPLDEKLPMTQLSLRQVIERLDTRLLGVVRIDEQRSFAWPGEPKVAVPGFDVLLALDGMAVVFDAYAGLLRKLPNATATAEGDMEWIEVDAGIDGAPWLKPVLAKNAKTGRLFLATSKAFAKEYLAEKPEGKRLAKAADWKRASARFLPKANGTTFVSGALLGKVERFVRPLAKNDKQAQAGIDVVMDLLPAPGMPYAAQQVNLDDGVYSASYATMSHKSALLPALLAGPMVVAGAVAAVATSAYRKTARAITAETPPADEDGEAPPAVDPAVERFRIPRLGAAHGAANPTVSIVEVSDFQCPFCGRVNETLRQLLARYPNDVRIYFRHNPLPFHADAPLAAQAAEAAGAQGKFWEMHDQLFANQKNLKRPDLERHAKTIGLDLQHFNAALDQGTFKQSVADSATLATQWGARGTPFFFVNGRKLSGAQPLEKFTALIDEEIAIAKRLMAKGTRRAAVYDQLMIGAAEPKPYQPPAPRAEPELGRELYRVPLGNAPARGGDAPKVTIVEYSDFQCPFCARVQATLDELAKTYGKDLRLVFKHNPLPFHARALPAALAAEAAREQGKFWALHDLLFAHQQELGDDELAGYAEKAGLDLRRYRAALAKSEGLRRRIEADEVELKRLGMVGAPMFFVNGRPLRGAQPIETWKKLIDEELVKADAKLRAGVPRKRLYAELTRTGVERAPKPKPAPGQPDPDAIYRVDVEGAPMRGPRDALVTVVQFSDYQCPFCRRVEPTLDRILSEHKGDVRIVWRDMPLEFHTRAKSAAIAARAAGQQGKYWQMHDKLFGGDEGAAAALEQADIERYADELGLDAKRFAAAIEGPALAKAVEQDIALGKQVGATSTPSFFINGKYLAGAQPYAKFKAQIDEALAAARKLVAKGTPKSKVYSAIMRKARASVDATE
jgi:protein-disulfide isomerase